MSMNNIFTKLRNHNKSNYNQLLFCITFAIMLVTSFGSTMFSPTIQNALDDGGDSRKMIVMIFVIAIVGCLLFSIYTIGLFLKYKSKETGVFLALGTQKRILSKALYTELLKILLQCTLIGIIIGVLISFGIWQGFNTLFVKDVRLEYQFSILGIVSGLAFSFVIGISLLILEMQFMKRSNLMDILNEERRSEPLGAVTKKYLVFGIIFLILGLVLGYVIPVVVANAFHVFMPSFWNLTYLLVLLGMYRIIAYAISYNKRGRNPQKYYKNLISSSMMKFQGKQTVRNMLVIALLIGASLFALSYVPLNGLPNLWQNSKNPTDFAMHYKLNMDEVTKEDIYKLANDYKTEITKYDEFVFSELVGSGVERDFTESGDFFEEYSKEYKFSEFVKESTFNEAMNLSVSIPQGQYILLTQPESIERLWVKYNDLDLVTNLDTGKTLELSFFNTLENHSLARNESQRYILNDSDYEIIINGISKEHQTKQILFNVVDVENSYPFAKALFQLFLEKAPLELARMSNYDAYQHSIVIKEGGNYGYASPVSLNWENPELMSNWKYYPIMKIVVEKTFFKGLAVQFLLFIYVAVICLCAVGIIAYTRSVSVGLTNKQLFIDLEKLGANNKYITKIITSQLNKIFVIPTIIGSILMLAFIMLISFGNDGQFTQTEAKGFLVNLLIMLTIWVYLFIVYWFSLRKVKDDVGIKRVLNNKKFHPNY